MTGNKQDAEDILQDAFFQAYINISKLNSMDSFGAWLKRIVINQGIRFLRARIHFSDVAVPDQEEEVFETCLEEHTMQRINKEIQELPDGCRIVFILYLLEDYSHKEIAEALNISESTSKSQYHRARKLLQERLTKNKVYG
jgi:RNA polymerase sigma-70 factor (ECF subfamily)